MILSKMLYQKGFIIKCDEALKGWKQLAVLLVLLTSTALLSVKAQSSLLFEGNQSLVANVSSNGVQLANNYTLEFWMRSANTTTQVETLSEFVLKGGTSIAVELNPNGFPVLRKDNIRYPSILLKDLRDGDCHRFAFVREGSLLRLYVDGQLAASATSLISVFGAKEVEQIVFASRLDGDLAFSGRIDEIRLWEVSKTLNQIDLSQIECLTGDEAGLIANWRLDEGSGAEFVNQTITPLVNLDILSNVLPKWSEGGCFIKECCELKAELTISNTDPDIGELVTLSNSSETGSVHFWLVNGDSLFGEQISFEVTEVTGYHVQLKIIDGSCENSIDTILKSRDYDAVQLKSNNCLIVSSLNQVPKPNANGCYLAGTKVKFCYNIDQWSSPSKNWIHGVEISIGNGWDLTTLVPTPPSASDGKGYWGWYPGVTSDNGNSYGQGFYYERETNYPTDGNPGNNLGHPTSSVSGYCFEIVAKAPDCNGNQRIVFNPLTDSESGTWDAQYASICSSDSNDEYLFNTDSCYYSAKAIGPDTVCAGQPFSVDYEICNNSCSPNPFQERFTVVTPDAIGVQSSGDFPYDDDNTGRMDAAPGNILPGCKIYTANFIAKPNNAGEMVTYHMEQSQGSGRDMIPQIIPSNIYIAPDTGLSITKTTASDFYKDNDSVEFIFTYTNNTNRSFSGVQLTDNLGVEFDLPYSPAGGYSLSGNVLTGPVINLASKSTRVDTVKVPIRRGTNGVFSNTANLNLPKGYCGTPDSSTCTYIISNLPPGVEDTIYVCRGDTFTFPPLFPNIGNTVSFNWGHGTQNFDAISCLDCRTPTVYNMQGNNIFNRTRTDALTNDIAVDKFWVFLAPDPDATIKGGNTVFCANEPVELEALIVDPSNSGMTYSWYSDSPGNFSQIGCPSCPATYVYDVKVGTTTFFLKKTSAAGCTDIDQIDIIVQPIPLSTPMKDLTVCPGERFIIGGDTNKVSNLDIEYQWYSATPGNYTNIVCNQCEGTAVNGINKATKFYRTTTFVATGCSNTDSVFVNLFPKVDATISRFNDTAFCANDINSIYLNGQVPDLVGLGVVYKWTSNNDANYSSLSCTDCFGTQVIGLTATTTFYFEKVSQNGCTDKDSITVVIKETPTPDVGIDPNVYCPYDVVQLVPKLNPGDTDKNFYLWGSLYPDRGEVLNCGFNCPDVEAVVYKNNATFVLAAVNKITKCIAYDTLVLSVYPYPNPEIERGMDTVFCEHAVPTFTLKGKHFDPYPLPGPPLVTYEWTSSNDANFSSFSCSTCLHTDVIGLTATTTFYLTKTSVDGCSYTDSITMVVNPNNIGQGFDKQVCIGEEFLLGPEIWLTPFNSTYFWSSELNEYEANILNQGKPGTYVSGIEMDNTFYRKFTNQYGCNYTDTFYVSVNAKPFTEIKELNTFCFGTSQSLADSAYVAISALTPNFDPTKWPFQASWKNISAEGTAKIACDTCPTTTIFNVKSQDTIVLCNTNKTTGCVSCDTIQLKLYPIYHPEIYDTDTVFCSYETDTISLKGKTKELIITDLFDFKWTASKESHYDSISCDTCQLTDVFGLTKTTTFYFTVTSPNGCNFVDSVEIKVNPAPIAIAKEVAPVCKGEQVTLTPSGYIDIFTYEYAWRSVYPDRATEILCEDCPIVDVNLLKDKATFILTLTNRNTGCVGADTLEIGVNPLPGFVGNFVTDTFCIGDTVPLVDSLYLAYEALRKLNPNIGPYPQTNSWVSFGGTGNVLCSTCPVTKLTDVAPPGKVIWTKTIPETGCSDFKLLTIPLHDEVHADAGGVRYVCNETDVLLSPGPGSSFDPNHPPRPIGVGFSGRYEYTWLAVPGYSGNYQDTECVTTPCSTVRVHNVTGTVKYVLTVTDTETGCIARDTTTIHVSEQYYGLQPYFCIPEDSGVVHVDLPAFANDPGDAFTWTKIPADVVLFDSTRCLNSRCSSIKVYGLGSATGFKVSMTDSIGCKYEETTVVLSRPEPEAITQEICPGDTGYVAEINYPWPLAKHQWYVKLEDRDHFSHFGTPDSSVTAIYGLTEGTWFYVYTYREEGVAPNTYQCGSVDSVYLHVRPNYVIADAGEDRSFCAPENGEVMLTLNGNFSLSQPDPSISDVKYVWQRTDGNIPEYTIQKNWQVSVETSAYFVLVVSDSNLLHCPSFDTIHITLNPKPELTLAPEIFLCEGETYPIPEDSVEVTGGTAFIDPVTDEKYYHYSWTTSPNIAADYISDAAVQAPDVAPAETGTYYLTVTDSLGCTDNGSMLATVFPQDEYLFNGTFEDGTTPDGRRDINLATHWYASSGTPDLFDTDMECTNLLGLPNLGLSPYCSMSPLDINCVSIPCNRFGYQEHRTTADGRYAGLWFMAGTLGAGTINILNPLLGKPIDLRLMMEGMQTHLAEPLIVGKEYTLSMWVSKAEKGEISALVTDPESFFRVKLSEDSLTSDLLNYDPIDAHVLNDALFVVSDDTLNWQQIQVTFTPDKAYEYLTIETWYPHNVMERVLGLNGTTLPPSPITTWGIENYFYIDDISIIEKCPYDGEGQPTPPMPLASNDEAFFDHAYQQHLSKLEGERKAAENASLTGVEKVTAYSDAFQLYPNPNNGSMRLRYQLPESTEDAEFSITDVFGRLLYNQALNNVQGEIDVQLSNVANGMYYYHIKLGATTLYQGKVDIIK